MNKKEFAEYIEAIRTRLYRTAFMYLNNDADAMEATDEAVYKALKSLKSLKDDSYFNTWITRILINVCKDELRRSKKLRPEEEDTINNNILKSTTLSSEISSIDIEGMSLKDAIQLLPSELKDIIILRFFTGLTLSETASELNIPQGTVVTRQRKALSILRIELLEEEQYE